jgi:hypothetical protein
MSETFFPHSYLARYPRLVEGADPDAPVVPAEHPPHRGTCLEYETTLASQGDALVPGPVCQYCLADPRVHADCPGHRAPLPGLRCPVPGTAPGPRVPRPRRGWAGGVR